MIALVITPMIALVICPVRAIMDVLGDGYDATVEQVAWLENELHIPTSARHADRAPPPKVNPTAALNVLLRAYVELMGTVPALGKSTNRPGGGGRGIVEKA